MVTAWLTSARIGLPLHAFAKKERHRLLAGADPIKVPGIHQKFTRL